MRWVILILWSIMPCYVALITNDADAGIVLTVLWTLVTLIGFGMAGDDDRYYRLFKLWIVIHLLDIMIMIWYFNQP
jgi:hypothetical protein